MTQTRFLALVAMLASNSGRRRLPRPGQPEISELVDLERFDQNAIFSPDGDAGFEVRTLTAPHWLGSQKSVISSISTISTETRFSARVVMRAPNSGRGRLPTAWAAKIGDVVDLDNFEPNSILSPDGDGGFEFRTQAASHGLGSQKSVIWSIRQSRPKFEFQPE